MHVLDARATSRSFSSTTSHSTSPTNLPALTTRAFARSYALHTDRRTFILSSIVARLSSSASVLRYAKPLRVLEVGGAPGVWVDDKLGIGNLFWRMSELTVGIMMSLLLPLTTETGEIADRDSYRCPVAKMPKSASAWA